MGNSNSCIRHFKELVLSSIMGASSMLETTVWSEKCNLKVKELDFKDSSLLPSRDSEYVTAPATQNEVSKTYTSPFLSARNESMVDSGKSTSVEAEIEHSKRHWSQVVEFYPDKDEVTDNMEVFKTLQMHPKWGTFFYTFGDGELIVGEKFAEGAQAELYEAKVNWESLRMREYDVKYPVEYVLKVFKKGALLRHLQSQWPQGLLHFHVERVEHYKCITAEPLTQYSCDVVRGTLLKDGRFAFLMQREREDLRKLIDSNMLKNGQDCGPFLKEDAEWIMYDVAKGMQWLHDHDNVHRDLKASNVLFGEGIEEGSWTCFVADFECSVGVVGTGFFRPPEVLKACKDRNVDKKEELFTKQVDVYTYGMTCYEILTGKLPFEDHLEKDFDHVIKGQRPSLPNYIDDWARELLTRCWHSDPSARPTFGEILDSIVANISTKCRRPMDKILS